MQPQRSFADVEYDGQKRQTRRAQFLRRMDGLIPWHRLEARLGPIYPAGERGRPPYPLAMMLRIHGVQLFDNLSDPAMEDALYDSVAVQRFVGLAARDPRPDETTILNFRHLLEQHDLGAALLAEVTQHLAARGVRLREGTIVDATIIDAPASTQNRTQQRDPEMHQVKKGNQWYFGMKGPHWGRRPDGSGAQRGDDGGECRGCDAGAAVAPRRRDAGVGGRGVSGRGAAPGAPGPGHGLADRPAGRAPTAAGAGQCGRAHGAAQGLDPGEGRASVLVREAPLWLRDVRYRGLAKNRNRLCLLFGLANLLLAERAAPA